MIPMMGNSGTPDVLGALSGTPTSMSGGPMGMLANAPSTGMGGLPIGGALSGGGISPQLLQLLLGGLRAGAGLQAGRPVGQVLQGATQDILPGFLQMQQQQAMAQQGQQGGGEQGGDQLAQLLAALKAKGLLGDAEGPISPSGPANPGGPVPQVPPAGYGMQRGYGYS